MLGKGEGLDQSRSLERDFEVLLDPSNHLTIDDVQKPPFESAFIPHGVQHSHPTFTNGTVWVRFSLAREASATDDWVIQLYPTWLDEIRVYTGVYREARLVMVLGDQHPFSERALKTNLPAFPVSLGTTPQNYYLQIRTHGPMPLVLNAWHKGGLMQKERQSAAVNLLLAGGVTALILMFLILWVWIQDGIYLVLSLFVGAVALYTFTQAGYGSSLLFPNEMVWGDRSVDVAICLFSASTQLLLCRMFDYRSRSVVMARLSDSISVFFALLVAPAFLGLLDTLWWWFITVIGCLAILDYVLLVQLIAQRRKCDDFPIMAMILLMSSVWTIHFGIQQGLGPIDHSFLEKSVSQLILAGSMLALTIAVANRLFNIELQRRVERQRAFESLRIASQALEDHSRQREFVAVISHEFRTPLAIITAVSHALEVSPAGQDQRVKNFVKKNRKTVQRLTGLIENLLLNDALESGRSGLDNDCFDLREVVWRVQNNCLPEDRERLQISFPDEALMLLGSRERVEMLLWNIIQNALKYSELKVEVNGQTKDDFLMLDVSSVGDPIPKPEQARLFDRYFRGAQSSGIPGSGLGLHIARCIARQHGGDVALVSSDATGTVFRVFLPLEFAAGVAPKPAVSPS
ncbi:sensor histidine kinase [Variovorax boronicumulans]|uniref:sensor histidine kinase n=1 Tax=Variovorax boronicumulans TaxID=436515 RepID=UPI00142DA781|nr:sensor histidine kinase [Variovorax boronicumulans]